MIQRVQYTGSSLSGSGYEETLLPTRQIVYRTFVRSCVK